MTSTLRPFMRRSAPMVSLLAAFWLAASPGAAADESGGTAPGEQPGGSLKTVSPGLATPSDSVSAESASAPLSVIAQPKLVVQRGSGDFKSFHDSIVTDGTTPVRLRWSPVLAATAKARWTTRAFRLSGPSGPRNAPSGVIPTAPEPGKWSYTDVVLFRGRGSLPPGPTRYELTVTALNTQGDAIGQPSKPITIVYQPPTMPPRRPEGSTSWSIASASKLNNPCSK